MFNVLDTNSWWTSDLHIDHKNIIQYSNRPWTFEQQREEIITRWNSRVKPMDHVYHLGDFVFTGKKGFNKTLEIINELNGLITFIKGNHCNDTLWKLIEDANIPHVVDICDYKEITVVCQPEDEKEISRKQKVIMCHYPFETWNLAHHGSWHLHGHCHGSLPPRGKRLDVGIDNHPDFQIFSFAEIKEHMDAQAFVVNDHHTGDRP
jgi:calcineurin-like phosphoesterase family protein